MGACEMVLWFMTCEATACRFDLWVFPSAALQDGCRQGRHLVRIDIVRGLRNMDLGWSVWVRRRSRPVRSVLGATTQEGPSNHHLRSDRRFSLSAMLSGLPLCMMNADVANQDDAGWEFTLSANCSDQGMTTACGSPSSNAPLGWVRIKQHPLI